MADDKMQQQRFELKYIIKEDVARAVRDFVSGLEYLKSSQELGEQGMRFELRAYDRRVLLDFREVHDSARAPCQHRTMAESSRPAAGGPRRPFV